MSNTDFDFHPQIPGYETSGEEPSLRDLIQKYYGCHFEPDLAQELTEKYIEIFNQH